MRKLRTTVVALVLCSALCGFVFAQPSSCNEIAVLAGMARAKSSTALAAKRRRARNDYRAQVVYATRSFQLRPQERHAAVLLLSLIPKKEAEHMALMTLGDSLCNGEPVIDMEALGRIRDKLPGELARAVLLVPAKLPDYISYAFTATQDTHSDYAVQMETVCKAKHSTFVKAVQELQADRREWFVKHILNPNGCHALALPEAE